MRVCCLTRRELMDYTERRIAPLCKNLGTSDRDGHHTHKPYKQIEAVAKDDGTGMATWVGGHFMCFLQNPKVWRPVRGVLQLVNGVVTGFNTGAQSATAKSRGHGYHYPIPGGGGGRTVYEFGR